MLDIKKIEKITLEILDLLPKKNIIGSTMKEIEDGYRALSEIEKINYAINLSCKLLDHLDVDFKLRQLMDILENIVATDMAKKIAKDIRNGVDGAINEANKIVEANRELIGKTMKERALGARNAKIEEILSKAEGKAKSKVNKKPVERID